MTELANVPEIASKRPVVARRNAHFWVGVERVQMPFGTVAKGQMYVYYEAPENVTKPHPIVLVHGGGGQGLDWMTTPDGRPGWMDYLVEDGWQVYVVDRPGHGRAAFHPDVLGAMGGPFPYEAAMAMFTAVAEGPLSHPAASGHTQWLDTGKIGDPYLDAFIASAGPMIADFAAAHALEQSRLAELLDKIGEPVVLMSHSAGGPAGWLAADARPDLVKVLVQIEPIGPPFLQNPDMGVSLDWGLAAAPITYDPPVKDPSELQGGSQKLDGLSKMPIAVVTSPTSPFTMWDPLTAEFVRERGGDVEHVKIEEHGPQGNGHLMMFEKNSREVLDVITRWVESKLG